MFLKEFHFHVYFETKTKKQAYLLHRKLIKAVKTKKFIAVTPGITTDILSQLNHPPPNINHKPVGPHTKMSFEIWVPQEYFTNVLSFMMENRDDLSILIHPLSNNEILDHTVHAMWLGKPCKLNLDCLNKEDQEIRSQYPELNLGYSKHI